MGEASPSPAVTRVAALLAAPEPLTGAHRWTFSATQSPLHSQAADAGSDGVPNVGRSMQPQRSGEVHDIFAASLPLSPTLPSTGTLVSRPEINALVTSIHTDQLQPQALAAGVQAHEPRLPAAASAPAAAAALQAAATAAASPPHAAQPSPVGSYQLPTSPSLEPQWSEHSPTPTPAKPRVGSSLAPVSDAGEDDAEPAAFAAHHHGISASTPELSFSSSSYLRSSMPDLRAAGQVGASVPSATPAAARRSLDVGGAGSSTAQGAATGGRALAASVNGDPILNKQVWWDEVV